MPSLSPQAYCYLRHPVLSSGETMLQYTIQHLCFTGALEMEKRRMAAHARDPRRVDRMLVTRVDDARAVTRAEREALDLFPKKRPISLGELRRRIAHDHPDLERFKWEYVLPDLLETGLMRSKFARTRAGKEAMEDVRSMRKMMDRRIDDLVQLDRNKLVTSLNELGSNIVLLKKETRDKLHGLAKEVPELAITLKIGGSMGTMTAFGSFAAFDTLSIGDSFDSASDFGGFGDGDFGGGGAGGDW